VDVTPLRHEGLGNSAYLVDLGDGEAALVDPGRVIGGYLAAAGDRRLRIRAVLETHLHADFVTGSLEIAAATGADVFVAAGADVRFPHKPVRPDERFTLADVEIRAIASPGHTPEHLSYLARPGKGPAALFSGGSLIVGGAARTDLIDSALTEELTRAQFRTLQSAFRHLPDETLLMPTHGGGSFCSVGDGGRRGSTLGEERRSNPLLQIRDEDEFARWFPTSFPAAPSYFARMRRINQRGPRLRRDVPMPRALNPEEFDEAGRAALVVDARPMQDYARGHVPGALSDPFRDAFAVWLGWLVPADARLAFVVDEGDLQPVVEESMLVGYEAFAGWLAGGVDAWSRAGLPLRTIDLVDPVTAGDAMAEGAVPLDVREPGELADGLLPGAINVPLGQIGARAGELPRNVPFVVYCSHGQRASSAVSLLESAGVGPLLNLNGGIGAWREAGCPVEGPRSDASTGDSR
jgi:rhodanese-related sulfurtransferase/glyoxylase-like metal-dependent hydrolase (beta-lactamase superfamily II)